MYTKKPTLSKFQKIAVSCKGIRSKIARHFGVSRQTVTNWAEDDPQFKDALAQAEGESLDQGIETAWDLANGIRDFDEEDNWIGWRVRPDTNMLRFMLSSKGKEEGFSERMDVTTNGKDLNGRPDFFRVLTPDEIKDYIQKFEEEY